MRVQINEITVDQKIQLRARWLDQSTVQRYVEALSGGAEFPPVVAFSDNGTLWLADGFHRLAAYNFLGLADVEADIKDGNREAAMVYAATANVTNGLPMTAKQKRQAGERLLRLTEWETLEIARKLAVNKRTVQGWKQALQNNKQDNSNKADDKAKTFAHLPDTIRLITGDFAEAMQELEAESIDTIITDPPYGMDSTHLYGILAREGARLLKSGGSLLTLAGQLTLPAIYNLMQPHLTYHWTIAYLTPGGQSPQIWSRNVNTFWKPVLWFVKGKYQGAWRGDVIKSDVNDNDKRFHDWGQSESGISKLVSEFAFTGTVLDPFVGGGTVGVVCYRLRKPFIGIDIDPKAIETTKGRILQEIINEQNTKDQTTKQSNLL